MRARSLPATNRAPWSAVSSRLINRSIVDLPDPDGPTRKTNSPLSMFAVQPSRALMLPLYTLLTFSKVIIALSAQDRLGCRGVPPHAPEAPDCEEVTECDSPRAVA